MTQPQPLKNFPNLTENTLKGVIDVVQKVSQVRQDDQTKWKNLNKQFLSGRTTFRVPSGPTDVVDGDVVGDVVFDKTGIFALLDISGTPTWVQFPPAPVTPGISATITTAALTTLGTQGSMTFVDGLLTAQVAAT